MSIAIKAHQQDDDVSCGRACAQMIIGFEWDKRGVLSGTALPGQSAMAAAETGSAPDWATEPGELAEHINAGLIAVSASPAWTVFEAKPSPAAPDPNVDAANQLLALVRSKLDSGLPSVIMVDGNDHWEVARDYYGDCLFTIDPLPMLGTPTVHSDVDVTCVGIPNTIWFFDHVSARAVICDVDPFKGSAIAIVYKPAADPAILAAANRARRPPPNPRPLPDPLRLRGTPIEGPLRFLTRDLWRLIGAMARLPEPARLEDFDWLQAVVREAAFTGKGRERIVLVGVPPAADKRRALLIALGPDGATQAVHVTGVDRLVASLQRQPAEPLWLVGKYGRWQPFALVGKPGATARLRRLHDDVEITVAASDLDV